MKLGSNRIIVPLSGRAMDEAEATRLITLLTKLVWGFKLHPSTIIRLMLNESFDIIAACKNAGAKVFIDLKGYDIPSEVAEMIDDFEQCGVDLITVHASGGSTMLEFAAKARKKSKLLAISILTSMKPEVVQTIYTDDKACYANKNDWESLRNRKILQFAKMAFDTGFDGTVSSAADLALFQGQDNIGNGKMIRCTPGIRPNDVNVENDDQDRIVTPIKALRAGSHLLVVGRPIKEASDPAAVAAKINQEAASIHGQ